MNQSTWKPLELIKTTADYFSHKSIPSPRLDAEVLLAYVLQTTRVKLYTDFERPLNQEEVDNFRELVRRRSHREPVSHILGKKEFMGLEFKVTPDVLTPRPETEIMVEEALKILEANAKKSEKSDSDNKGIIETDDDDLTLERTTEEIAKIPAAAHVLDLCTGSGCIAVSIASKFPSIKIVATDICSNALLVARENADSNGVWPQIDFREGDLFNACWANEQFDLILSNPPYLVEDNKDIWPEVRDFEPSLALYGGQDGLDFYRKIIAEAEDWLAPGGTILFEVGAGQSERVTEMLAEYTLLGNIRMLKDHSGIERVVIASRAEL